MRIFFLFYFILAASCSKAPKPLPDWVTQSKSNPAYWLGIGSGQDRENAVSSAANSIASQISIQVESNMKNLKIEKNQEIINYTRNIIETRVNMSLPEVEIKDVILHDNTWYARAELNKKLYYNLLEEKRENARQAIVGLVEEDENSTVIERMNSLYAAWQEITPYIDVPITADINGQKNVNLYAEIQSLFRKLIVGLNIELMNEIPKLSCVLPLNHQLNFRLSSFQSRNTAGLPFTVSLNSGLINNVAVADQDRLNLIISKIFPGYESGVLSVRLDIENILQTTELPSVFQIEKSISVPVHSKPIKIYIDADEINLGRKSNRPQILPLLSEHFLTKYKAVKVNSVDESDISVLVKSESKKGNSGDNEWGIFKAMAECMVTVTLTSEDQNLYMGTLHHIQGSDFTSFKSAGSKALKNLASQIVLTLLPEMDDVLIKG